MRRPMEESAGLFYAPGEWILDAICELIDLADYFGFGWRQSALCTCEWIQ
jgi:hypothetical protein